MVAAAVAPAEERIRHRRPRAKMSWVDTEVAEAQAVPLALVEVPVLVEAARLASSLSDLHQQ